MKIDSHQHFWKYDPVAHSWITDEMRSIRKDFQPYDLQPLLKKHGFDGCIVVQVDQTEAETLQLVALSDQYDFIRGVVGWIDLRNPNLESRLEFFSTLKNLNGFRHIVQSEAPGFLGQPSFVRGVQKLKAFEFTYDLLVHHYQLGEALAFLKQTPDTRIVIDHIAKPDIASGSISEWRNRMEAIAVYENVFCKVSGMVTSAASNWKYEDFVPYLDVLVKAFGTSRLMYGSDWPVSLVAATYDEQLSIVQRYFEAFSGAEKKMIFGENAKRFYNL